MDFSKTYRDNSYIYIYETKLNPLYSFGIMYVEAPQLLYSYYRISIMQYTYFINVTSF